jgi:hypothetical protein
MADDNKAPTLEEFFSRVRERAVARYGEKVMHVPLMGVFFSVDFDYEDGTGHTPGMSMKCGQAYSALKHALDVITAGGPGDEDDLGR